jgi:hypothetical protein
MVDDSIPDFSSYPVVRTPMSKKLRFDVFKRDGFVCQYCGAHPPAVILEVDHIHPVAAGGKNRMDNLITSCFDCNRGKGAGLLSVLPESVSDRAAVVAERLAQNKAYERLLRTERKNEDVAISFVEEAFQANFPSRGFTDTFKQSVRTFLKNIDQFTLADYMHRACARRPDSAYDATKYFCGICWNVIKDQKHGSR